MGKIFSTVTDAVGLTNTKAEKAAASASAAASANANALAADQLEFAKDQYEDWKAIYGSVQDNLGQYYNSLGADKVATLGLQSQQQEYQAAVRQIKSSAAARGLDGSTYEQATIDNATLQNATIRAGIRATAEDTAAQAKLGFLGVGLGQGASYLGNVTSAFNTGVNAFANQSSNLLNRSNQLNATNSKMLQTVYNDASSAVGAMVGGA